jgi:hypothetical protein
MKKKGAEQRQKQKQKQKQFRPLFFFDLDVFFGVALSFSI